MDKFDYKTHSVLYKNNYIQTYEFGEGDNVVIAFPSYPHSGLYYLKLFMHNTKSDIRFIVFDLPGWAGYSDNIFRREEKRREEIDIDEYVEIAKTILKDYSVDKFSILGYSFGGALALKLAADMKPRVKNMVLVSGVVNSHISQKDTLIRLIKLLRFSRLQLPLKLISKVQTQQIKKILIKEGSIPVGFLGRYIDMVNKIDYKVIIESIYQLFTSDYTKYLNKVDDIPSLVISSKDEYKLFVQQSEFLRKKLVNHKSLYTEGTHEDFMISSNQKVVERIVDFLKK